MASMRDIKRRKGSIPEYAADHQSHEAGFNRKAAESQKPCGTDGPVFQLYVQNRKFHAGTKWQYQSSVFAGRRFRKEKQSLSLLRIEDWQVDIIPTWSN